MGQLTLALQTHRQIFAVSELNSAIADLLGTSFRQVAVSGEISGCRIATSGHYYFTLKDARSQIKCVLFKSSARFTRLKPRDGLSVIVRGSIDVYTARGEYQLLAEALEPQGAGALQLAFEDLKRRLTAEGLFEGSRKKLLPRIPRAVGLITSPKGAVIRDILHVLERRYRGLLIRIYPVQVQGEGSVEQVCAALAYFNANTRPDVLILARGGGSIEDLWTFNEEAVARSIARSVIPVISAIGHETDFTISDFVADVRAPTPSAAAEILVCTSDSLQEQIAACRAKILQSVRYRLLHSAHRLAQHGAVRSARLIHRRLTALAQRIDDGEDRLTQSCRLPLGGLRRKHADLAARLHAANLPLQIRSARHRNELLSQRLCAAAHRVAKRRDRLEATGQRCSTVMANRLRDWRARITLLSLQLEQLSPWAVLARGYAIVQTESNVVLTDAALASPGDILGVRLHRGDLQVRVQSSD